MAASGQGLAQVSGNDPLNLLQQIQRGSSGGLGGLGGLNGGVVDTTSQLPQNQILQPQSMLAARQPPSRLEQILSARAGVRLQQFGYDQLGTGRQVMVPEIGAVADDYIMGPGDEVVVSLRGQENSDFRTTVDRNGRVVLPRLPPISAAGRSFGSFREDVDAAVHRAYVASTASTSIGRVRQISVLVSGEVNVPGQRIVTGLSSVVDVLLLSNGVKKTGSLRNVRVQRAGHQYTVDLYSVLTGSGSGGAMRLADGDRVVVPPLGGTVAVAGLVRRPGIYELPGRASGMTARSLLALAGGPEVRGKYRLAVQRIEPDGRLNLATLQSEKDVVRDSEVLRLELNADLATSQATLSGGVGLAGQFAVSTGSRLSDVLRAPGAMGQSPYSLFGIIVRKDQRTLLRSLMAFTPVAVLSGTEDLQLQSDDIIRPLTIGESQMLAYVVKTYLDKLAYDQSLIRNPLEAQNGQAVPVSGASSTAAAATGGSVLSMPLTSSNAVSPTNPFGLEPGQLESYSFGQDDFSSVPADTQRANIVALLDVATPGTPLALQREAAYQRALAANTATASTSGLPASPAQIAQQQQAALLAVRIGTTQPAVPGLGLPGSPQDLNGMTVGGVNGFGGVTDLNGQMNGNTQASGPPAANFQDQAVAPGSIASNQEVQTFGELSRQLGIDPLVLINFLIDHRARLDGAVRGPGPYFIGPNVSLADLVQAAGGTVSWADESGVELLTTVVDSNSGRAASQRQSLPLRQGTLVSYVVRPRDQLHFNKVFTDTGIGSVSVQGEVRFAGNYPITRGEHLSDLLVRAGGLNGTAYPAGTVFLRKSAAQVEEQGYKRTANEIQSQLLAGMARIGNDKISGEGFTAIQGFINQLRSQKGLGRIAIAADPSMLAANPQLDPLLEAGDVVFIPQRPSTIAVLGQVMQPGSYSYQPGLTVGDYVKKAGGYAQFSDEDLTYIVLPDGSARKIETSWLGYDATRLPPGSSIVVPRDLAPLTTRQIVLDVTGIMSSLAVTIASLAVLAKQ
ncbi:MAG TPA: SLBB domain-containing protein [Rhizomicrobium sp.]|nr:SLBB domain-containing protein [Rhizomicrobium sp.]